MLQSIETSASIPGLGRAVRLISPGAPGGRGQERSPAPGAVSAILHDLRNPVGVVYNRAELLLDFDLPLDQVKRVAGNIFDAATRMRRLTTGLAAAMAGEVTPREPCHIGDLIRESFKSAAGRAMEQGVDILIELSVRAALPLARARMQSVFDNLVANALDAMPDGGAIHIKASESIDGVAVEIEDNGLGIPPVIRDRLFEPFATAAKKHGLGLGLALSRQSVREHGGDLWLEPANGARFIIYLPISRKPY
jgi:signal transduction histidine kinase